MCISWQLVRTLHLIFVTLVPFLSFKKNSLIHLTENAPVAVYQNRRRVQRGLDQWTPRLLDCLFQTIFWTQFRGGVGDQKWRVGIIALFSIHQTMILGEGQVHSFLHLQGKGGGIMTLVSDNCVGNGIYYFLSALECVGGIFNTCFYLSSSECETEKYRIY